MPMWRYRYVVFLITIVKKFVGRELITIIRKVIQLYMCIGVAMSDYHQCFVMVNFDCVICLLEG